MQCCRVGKPSILQSTEPTRPESASRNLLESHTLCLSSSIQSDWHTTCSFLSNMKVALPVWQGRVSPVFDVAGQLLVVDIQGNQEVSRQVVSFERLDIARRADRLVEMGVETVICGAVSRAFQLHIRRCGVELFTCVCGTVDEILLAYQDGTLAGRQFAMPGCCGRQRRRCRGRQHDRVEIRSREP